MIGDHRRRFMEIPVYRLSERAFDQEQDRLIAPHLEHFRSYRDEVAAQILAAQAVSSYRWDFNEVVGWITVHGYHDVIKSYLWWTTSKQLKRSRSPRQHRYEPMGKLSETGVWPDLTDEEIAANLRADLLAALKEHGYSSRHLDLRSFDRIAPHLRWKAMLGTSGTRLT